LRDSVGGKEEILNMGWADPIHLDAFCGSLNSEDVLGEDARHARSRYAPPSTPMSLSQASEFLRKLIINWTEYLQQLP